MSTTTVGELKAFLASIPDDFQVWASQGDIHVAPRESRDQVRTFSGQKPDLEEMRRQMHAIAVSDHDCPV